LNQTAELVETTESFPLFDEEELESSVLYKLDNEADEIIVTRDPDTTWVLGGEKLEKLFKMTNFDHDESVMRFARQLRGMGIDELLRSRGAVDGDIVRILEYEFEFVD